MILRQAPPRCRQINRSFLLYSVSVVLYLLAPDAAFMKPYSMFGERVAHLAEQEY
jgi:hypothetical protein